MKGLHWLAAGACALLAACGAKPEAAAPADFTGLWTIESLESVKRAGEHDAENLTPKARAAREFFLKHSRGIQDQAVAHCVPHGLPWSMTSPARDYMHDIYQTKDRITVLFEGDDVYRVIHLDQKEVPEGFTASTWGYSIGHWEGDTLVIVSTHLTEKNPFGFNQRSDQAVVTERWRLVKDATHDKVLDIDIAIDDPVNYVKPSHGYERLVPGPPGTVLLPYGCTASVFDDYVAGRLAEIAKEEGKKP